VGDLDGLSEVDLALIPQAGQRRAELLLTLVSELHSVPLQQLSKGGVVARLPTRMLAAIARAESHEEELVGLLYGLSDRNRLMITDLWTLNRDRPPTLEAIGTKYNLTRERVRQLLNKRVKLLVDAGVSLPKGTQVVEVLEASGGASTTPRLLAECERKGLATTRKGLMSLPELSRIGLVPPIRWDAGLKLWLTERGATLWSRQGALGSLAKEKARELRTELKRSGTVPVEMVTEVSPFGPQHAIWLALERSVRTSSLAGYIILYPAIESTLSKSAAKILVVAGPLPLGDLCAGLRRAPRLRVPPEEVVRAVLDSHPSFIIDQGRIALREWPTRESLLSPSELVALTSFEQGGGTLLWTEAEGALSRAGYSIAMVNVLLQGPLFVRRSAGLYSIRGVEVDPALLRRKRLALRRARARDVIDSHWESPDNLVARYKVTRFALQGVLACPKELETVRKIWRTKYPDGRPGEVKIGKGFIWSLSKWFERVKVREGDVIIASFFLGEGLVGLDHVPANGCDVI
jgi:hypothetical protein